MKSKLHCILHPFKFTLKLCSVEFGGPPLTPLLHVTPTHTSITQITQHTNVLKRNTYYHTTTVLQGAGKHLFMTVLRQNAFLMIPPPHPVLHEPDQTRPTQNARLLLRVMTKESAQRELRPFYSDVVRSVLREEQARYRTRPTQAISLIWNLFGREHAFRTLTHFYFSALTKLGSGYYPALQGQNAFSLAAGLILHSRVYRQFMHTEERIRTAARYMMRESEIPDELRQLPAAQRSAPLREALKRLAGLEKQQRQEQPIEEPTVEPPALTQEDFRRLVRGVSRAIGRQAHREALRRGSL